MEHINMRMKLFRILSMKLVGKTQQPHVSDHQPPE